MHKLQNNASISFHYPVSGTIAPPGSDHVHLHDSWGDEDQELALILRGRGAPEQPPEERDIAEERHLGYRLAAVEDQNAADDRSLAIRQKDLGGGLVLPDRRLAAGAENRVVRCVL